MSAAAAIYNNPKLPTLTRTKRQKIRQAIKVTLKITKNKVALREAAVKVKLGSKTTLVLKTIMFRLS